MKRERRISLKRLKRYSLRERKSKVHLSGLAKPLKGNVSLNEFIDSLPSFLAAQDLREVSAAIVRARRNERPVILGMGAHPVKVGLSPLIIDAMEEGIITGIATNGATVVHDFELAFQGQTSEDVLAELGDGSFGMAVETGRMINNAIKRGDKEGLGLGEAVGRMISRGRLSLIHI